MPPSVPLRGRPGRGLPRLHRPGRARSAMRFNESVIYGRAPSPGTAPTISQTQRPWNTRRFQQPVGCGISAPASRRGSQIGLDQCLVDGVVSDNHDAFIPRIPDKTVERRYDATLERGPRLDLCRRRAVDRSVTRLQLCLGLARPRAVVTIGEGGFRGHGQTMRFRDRPRGLKRSLERAGNHLVQSDGCEKRAETQRLG